jgi:tripartite-type tricarboxylate transporter receptor subunit TctC
MQKSLGPTDAKLGGVSRRGLLTAGAAAALTPWSWAQAQRTERWPRAPVNLVVPFPAGGTSALLAKQLKAPFERLTRQRLQLQYFGGAGGMPGALYTAAAPADGQHLCIGGNYMAIARALYPSDDFDFLQDLRPLAMVAEVPQVVVIHPQRMRVRTVHEWLNELGRKPARYRMATASVGSASHLSAALLKHQSALNFDFVHFRGSGPALQDLLAGSVDMMLDGLVSCLPHVRSGRLKALLVTGAQRVSALPDVPCAQELNLAALDDMYWYGLFAPRKIAPATEQAVVQQLQRLGEDAQLQAALAASGLRWGNTYGDAFEALVQQQTHAWAQHLKRIGLDPLSVKSLEET